MVSLVAGQRVEQAGAMADRDHRDDGAVVDHAGEAAG
jgi:hypothetical protein